MPTSKPMPVKRLKIDLENYRTTKQANEKAAVEAIIAIRPEWFWALTESLLESGYLPTENMLVQEGTGARPSLVVKEGNRRLSALKLIHGFIPLDGLAVPSHIREAIANVSASWKRENKSVPCVIYSQSELDVANKIRNLTHGKGEKAGRDGWTAVARARHNRDENGVNEPALEVLEKWLATGQNHTAEQAKRWAGDYKLTVLEEALKRLAQRLGATSAKNLGDSYPGIKHRREFDEIIKDIGLGTIS